MSFIKRIAILILTMGFVLTQSRLCYAAEAEVSSTAEDIIEYSIESDESVFDALDSTATPFPLPLGSVYKATQLAINVDGTPHVSYLYKYTELKNQPYDENCVVDIQAPSGTP